MLRAITITDSDRVSFVFLGTVVYDKLGASRSYRLLHQQRESEEWKEIGIVKHTGSSEFEATWTPSVQGGRVHLIPAASKQLR